MSPDTVMMIDPKHAALVVRAAADAIITVDNRAQITSWNPATEALLGHSAQDAIGQSLALIIPEIHRSQHSAGFHAAMGGDHLSHLGQPARVEATAADGRVIPLVMSLGLLHDGDGVPDGVVAILRHGDVEPSSFISPQTTRRAHAAH